MNVVFIATLHQFLYSPQYPGVPQTVFMVTWSSTIFERPKSAVKEENIFLSFRLKRDKNLVMHLFCSVSCFYIKRNEGVKQWRWRKMCFSAGKSLN